MSKLYAFALTIAFVFATTGSSAIAQSITLTSLDGTVSVSGELLDFDGENYTLNTPVGTLTFASDLVECSGDGCPSLVAEADQITEFTIAGSSSIGENLIPAMIEAFALSRGGDYALVSDADGRISYSILNEDDSLHATIHLQLGTSNDAFTALESGAALIGLSTRRANEGEIKRILAAGYGNISGQTQERIVALGGIGIMVNNDNAVQQLGLAQIADIFSGRVTNWQELGGANAPISIYRRGADSGSTSVFETLVMAPARVRLANNAQLLQTDAEVSDALAQDINGIGVAALVDERNARILPIQSVCGIVSVPTEFSIKSEEYPLSRRLFMYLSGETQPTVVSELVDFIISDAAQQVVESAGYVDRNLMLEGLDNQGQRLLFGLLSETNPNQLKLYQEMVASLTGAKRLSLSFRFRSGSITPDNRALEDIDRLVEMIKNGDFEGKRLLLIGFADNIGAINENQRLSQARAESLRDAVIDAIGLANLGTVEFTPFGYGKISPIGCNETENGRETNRRVEVWVR